MLNTSVWIKDVAIKVLEKQAVMVTAYYSVCAVSSFIHMDSCPSASWAHAGKTCLLRSWCQQGESRAHTAILSWSEMDAGESISCLWGTQIFSEETEAAGAGDSARQNMKARSGHDTWWTQTVVEKLCPPPPLSPLCLLSFSFSCAARKRDPWWRGEMGKREMMLKSQRVPVELCPHCMCGPWSSSRFREMGSFKETLIGLS